MTWSCQQMKPMSKTAPLQEKNQQHQRRTNIFKKKKKTKKISKNTKEEEKQHQKSRKTTLLMKKSNDTKKKKNTKEKEHYQIKRKQIQKKNNHHTRTDGLATPERITDVTVDLEGRESGSPKMALTVGPSFPRDVSSSTLPCSVEEVVLHVLVQLCVLESVIDEEQVRFTSGQRTLPGLLLQTLKGQPTTHG